MWLTALITQFSIIAVKMEQRPTAPRSCPYHFANQDRVIARFYSIHHPAFEPRENLGDHRRASLFRMPGNPLEAAFGYSGKVDRQLPLLL